MEMNGKVQCVTFWFPECYTFFMNCSSKNVFFLNICFSHAFRHSGEIKFLRFIWFEIVLHWFNKRSCWDRYENKNETNSWKKCSKNHFCKCMLPLCCANQIANRNQNIEIECCAKKSHSAFIFSEWTDVGRMYLLTVLFLSLFYQLWPSVSFFAFLIILHIPTNSMCHMIKSRK